MTSRPAAGGGRWVPVGAERLAGWIGGFTDRHGPVEATLAGDVVRLRGLDGAVAECHVPFPPLAAPGADPVRALVTHAMAERRVGVLLVRLGGYAAGVFEGSRLVASKVGSRQVHGRSAAGGWSQHRFARRREKQAGEAAQAAADTAARILTPQTPTLEAVILGGDRRAITPLRSDPRLKTVFALETPPFLDVPDPKLAILQATPHDFRTG
ncbi:acVLRF1 family peptidyl-tRNA hydrolase, partial [Sphaerisporangium aureirubrum]